MKKEYSYGIIPIKNKKALLVKHQKGHWAFPKGHTDFGESPQMTAQRELFEETGLHVVRYFDMEPIEERYQFDDVDKKVTYFVAEVRGHENMQEEEIADFKWVNFQEGQELATFPETKKLCEKMHLVFGF